MGGWIHASVDLYDSSSGIDQEGVACGEFHDSEVGERSVGVGHLMLGVGEEFEIQSLLCAEVFVGIDTVEADSKNDCIALGVLRLVHLKLVGFAGSTWGLVFGIEIEDDPFSAVVFQADGRAVLRGEGEVGGHGAGWGRGVAREQSGKNKDESSDRDDKDQDAEHGCGHSIAGPEQFSHLII